MEAKFLRKIILEELKKVLKEVDYPDIPGSEPGQTKSPYQKGATSRTSRPAISRNAVEIMKIQRALRKIMGEEYRSSWPQVNGKLDKRTSRLIKILYPRLNLDKITNFRALSAVFEQRVQRGGTSIAGETFDQILDKAVAAAEQRRASASAGMGKDTEITADSPMPTNDSGLPKSPDDVYVPFTDKETMDKMIGPKKGFTRDPDALKDTGPKKGEEEDIKVNLQDPMKQEALVRAISKLLKKL